MLSRSREADVESLAVRHWCAGGSGVEAVDFLQGALEDVFLPKFFSVFTFKAEEGTLFGIFQCGD